MSKGTKGTFVVLGATALTLALLDLRGGPVTDGVRAAGAAVLGPMQTVAGAIANPAVAWVESTGSYSTAAERTRLWQEQAPAATQIRTEQRLAQLDAMLGIIDSALLTVVPSRVISYPANPLDLDHVVIDVGTTDGIQADEAVITGAGIVGRTDVPSPGTTQVKLLSAPDSAVGGRFLRTGQACVVLGTGDAASLNVRIIDPTADVQVGDPVVTFGSKDGRPFPPDLPIGVVAAIDNDGTGGRIIRLHPAAALGALDLVAVVVPAGVAPPRAPLQGMERPTPTPSPTPEPSGSETPQASPSPSRGGY